MPELPEIETLRRELEKDVSGKKIKTVEVAALKPIRRYKAKKQFTALLEGRKITGLERRGPYLVFKIEGGDAMVADLGLAGQLVRTKSTRGAPPKGTQITITFTQGGVLRLVDAKGDAEVFVHPLAELAALAEFADLGIDPLESSMSWLDFWRLIHHRNAKLKTLLMDRTVLCGIGPVYSDEILFAAGLRHDRESDRLTEQEVRRFYRAIVETMHDAVKYHQSAAAQSNRTSGDPFDEEHSEHLKVYERDGDTCRRCRRDIVKARIGNRMTYFCDACQV
jgi:formamidopyrimidine-DNA glycosylase